MKKTILAFFALILFSPMAFGVPLYLNYQGVLRDSSDNLQNGSFDMSFTIWNQASGGSLLFTDTQTGVSVADGVYSVRIGPITNWSTILNGSSTDRYLEVAVEGQTLTPRIRINSVAYSILSLHASTAAYATTASTAAYAVTAGSANTISDDSVTSGKIQDAAVTEAKIDNAAVTAAKIAAGSVGESKLAAGSVTAGAIAADAVEEAKIANGAVTNGKIGADAVTSDKIAVGSVGESKLAAGSVTAGAIAADAVEEAKIQNGAVTNGKIGADAVTSDKIADGDISSVDIADGTIVGADLDGAINVETTGHVTAGAVTADGSIFLKDAGSGNGTVGTPKEGVVGKATLSGASVTIYNSNITSNSYVFITPFTTLDNATKGDSLRVSKVNDPVGSFVVTTWTGGVPTDNDVAFSYLIVN